MSNRIHLTSLSVSVWLLSFFQVLSVFALFCSQPLFGRMEDPGGFPSAIVFSDFVA
jgi:hypothetical protein